MTTTMTETIGEAFVKSDAFCKPGRPGEQMPAFTADLDASGLKTLMTTTAGWAPQSFRDSGAVTIATRPLTLVDLVPDFPVAGASVSYMEETTFTNSAAETAEAGTYAESAFATTARTSAVQKISTFIPVTDEALEDSTEAAAYIDQRLGFALRQRLELQMLVGNGTAPNLRGVLNVAGISTQALGADTREVAIRKAITKLVGTPGYCVPNAIVLHPTDAEDMDVALATDKLAAYTSDGRVWRLPIIQNDAITLGTAVLGDWTNFAALRIRRGLTLSVSNSHSTFFVEGKQAIRADMRVAVVYSRPAAFCTVTGI